jgi:hypothetical protein
MAEDMVGISIQERCCIGDGGARVGAYSRLGPNEMLTWIWRLRRYPGARINMYKDTRAVRGLLGAMVLFCTIADAEVCSIGVSFPPQVSRPLAQVVSNFCQRQCTTFVHLLDNKLARLLHCFFVAVLRSHHSSACKPSDCTK